MLASRPGLRQDTSDAHYGGAVPLEEYRRKRDAARTPEPIPEADPAPGTDDRFVVQEHHARSLHWDVRLERDGVLASWAVPKGLPTEPDTVRLAVRTEDHPIEYLEFSGEIPAGEYGGGRMTIWDTGTYETEKWNPREVIVRLRGRRAEGRYVFIRTGDNWILRRSDPAPDRDPLPRDTRPMEATPGPLPRGDNWWLQVSFGGRRVIVRVDGGRARITDAEGAEIEAPTLRELGPSLGATPVLLDGELVGGDLWIGDLLHLDGRDVAGLPFRERRALLEDLPLAGPHWRPAPVFPGGGAEVVAAVREQRLGGVVAKDADAPYEPGARSPAGWPSTRPRRRPPAPAAVGRAKLTNPRKVLYPLTGTTKADVLAYYLAVADVMLPHLRDRPVTMVRWPDGVEKPSFFEKDVSRHAPSWIRTARVGTPGGRRRTPTSRSSRTRRAWRGRPTSPRWSCTCRSGGSGRAARARTPTSWCSTSTRARAPRWSTARGSPSGSPNASPPTASPASPRTSGGKGMQLYLPVTVSTPERTSAYAKALAEELAAETPRLRHRRDGEGPPPRAGVRGLEPEQPVQDHDRELLAARPGPADRRDPGHVGRGARGADRARGRGPSPVAPPSGCRFRTRCRYATEICRTERPPLVDHGGGRFAACHHPLDAKGAGT